jgi:hypothetical protein
MDDILVRILANPVTCTMLVICALGTGFMLWFLTALLMERVRDHKVHSPANDLSQTIRRYRAGVPLGAIRLDLGATTRGRTPPEGR